MKNADLHGSVPDQSNVALVLIDVINALDFDEADQFLVHALPAAKRIAELRKQAQRLDIPTIYVNDNFGKWRSDFKALLQHCLTSDCKGRELAALLRPDENDYFILKPKHSAFFSTALDTLLLYLRADTLIITGFAGNICVLFTANDAYMRDFHIYVPNDCIASNTLDENDYALDQMAKVLKADTTPSRHLHLESLIRQVSHSHRRR